MFGKLGMAIGSLLEMVVVGAESVTNSLHGLNAYSLVFRQHAEMALDESKHVREASKIKSDSILEDLRNNPALPAPTQD